MGSEATGIDRFLGSGTSRRERSGLTKGDIPVTFSSMNSATPTLRSRQACQSCHAELEEGISAAYGFHSAGVVKHDGASPSLRIFTLGVFGGPQKFLILVSVSANTGPSDKLSACEAREPDLCCRG